MCRPTATSDTLVTPALAPHAAAHHVRPSHPQVPAVLSAPLLPHLLLPQRSWPDTSEWHMHHPNAPTYGTLAHGISKVHMHAQHKHQYMLDPWCRAANLPAMHLHTLDAPVATCRAMQLMDSQLETWMDQFHRYLAMPDNPTVAERNADTESIVDGVRSAVCQNINLVCVRLQLGGSSAPPLSHILLYEGVRGLHEPAFTQNLSQYNVA